MEQSTMEEWRPVVGYEGAYEVSDQGRVRSLHKSRRRVTGGILAINHPSSDYALATLSRYGRAQTHAVHILVAAAFIGPRPEGLDVCHNDGDCANNHVSNLRYGTRRENVLDEIAHGTHYYASRTHCLNGHEFTEDNVYRSKGNPTCRQCRTCRRDRRSWGSPDRSSVADMLTPKQAAEVLGLAAGSIYVFMNNYEDFPAAVKVRNRFFFDPAAILAWRAAHPARPATKSAHRERKSA